MKQTAFSGLIFIFLLASCEKNIAVKIPDIAQTLVVEGYIENDKAPVVILTHSLNYFSTLDLDVLNTIFVHDAVVTVSDGANDVQLHEISTDTTGGIQFYMYTTNSSQNFKGRPGKKYDLNIIANNKTYSASATIPASGIFLDSLYVTVVEPTKENPDTTRVILTGRFTDPPAPGQYARYFTKRNDEPFYAGINSVADDEFTNGTVFDINLDRGQNKNLPRGDDYGFFHTGDTITVKFCDIDKATYDFWRTWEYAYGSNGNPFSSPIKIIGNIPGAAGYWGGYKAMYQTIVVPK